LKRFPLSLHALGKQRLEIEHEHDLLLETRLFGNDRTVMRVILIRLGTLVSMLSPCLLSIVCLALVVGTEDLERVDFCTMQ